MPVTNLTLFDEFDRDLLQRVRSFLCQKGYAPHRTLEIKVQRGVVQGRVPSFYLRQIAVECIKHVAGVTQVVDLIEVADGPLPRQANGNSEDEQASPAASTRHRTDSPVLARTAQDSHQTHFPNRHLLSSC